MLSFDSLIVGPCIAAFGENAQGNVLPFYTPQGGAGFAIDGVFDDGWHEVDILRESPITSSAPSLGVQLSAFPAGVMPQQGDAVTVRGNTYAVREVRPDSHGWARLMLNGPQ